MSLVYLLPVLHYIHYLPVIAGMVQSPEKYPYSSHRAYLGHACGSWLHTSRAIELLDGEEDGRAAYHRLLERRPSEELCTLFGGTQRAVPEILAGPSSWSRYLGSAGERGACCPL